MFLTEYGAGSGVIDDKGKLWSGNHLGDKQLHGMVVFKLPHVHAAVLKHLMQKDRFKRSPQEYDNMIKDAARQGESWLYNIMIQYGLVRMGTSGRNIFFSFGPNMTSAAKSTLVKYLQSGKNIDVEFYPSSNSPVRWFGDMTLDDFMEKFL